MPKEKTFLDELTETFNDITDTLLGDPFDGKPNAVQSSEESRESREKHRFEDRHVTVNVGREVRRKRKHRDSGATAPTGQTAGQSEPKPGK